jgi:hypothetical protein
VAFTQLVVKGRWKKYIKIGKKKKIHDVLEDKVRHNLTFFAAITNYRKTTIATLKPFLMMNLGRECLTDKMLQFNKHMMYIQTRLR